MVLSPYLWHSTWRGTGLSLAYVPFHLWCWLPFVLLALTAGRIGRGTYVAMTTGLTSPITRAATTAGMTAGGLILPNRIAPVKR